MWMPGEETPSDFFFDVIGAGIGVNFYRIGSFRFYAAVHMPRRHNEGVIAARTNSCCIIAAGH